MEPTTGYIHFSNGERRKYTVVDPNIDKTDLSKIFYEEWELTLPPLLVSIASDATDSLELGWRERRNIKRCLTKFLYNPGAWIISSGMHSGVMKYFSQPVSSTDFVAIEIDYLDNISQADELTKTLLRKSESFNEVGTEQDDPHNTHFILVDKIECSDESECLFRQRLEKKIDCAMAMLLVFGGGSEALEEVKNKLKNKTPVIVMKGTGRLADALAYAYQNSDRLYNEGVRENMKDILGKITGVNTETAEKDIASSINQHKNLIIVHDIHTNASETEDIGEAVFHALQKEHEEHNDELKNSLALNGCDLDQANQTKKKRQIDLPQTVTWEYLIALMDNKLTFVKMLFKGIEDKNMYYTIGYGSEIFVGKYEDTHNNVRKYLNGKWNCPAYLLSSHVDIPAHISGGIVYPNNLKKLKVVDFFICSVLMNHQEMAIFFWRHGENHIINALTGYWILNKMATQTDDMDEKIKLQSNASDFSNLAIQILNECFRINERRTHGLLNLQVKECGGISVIQLANKEFIAQPACQSLQRIEWHGELSQSNHWLQVLVCAVFPLLIFTSLVRFKPEVKFFPKVLNEDGDISWHEMKSKSLGHIRLFYTAPLVVFLLNVVSYSVFLMLFSYVMLVDLRKDFSALDYVLICWVITFLFEEVRQVITLPWTSVKHMIVGYIFDNAWNVLDVVTILLFMVGTGIRWFVQHESALEIARVVLAINLVAFFLRLLHMFSIHKEMGPKLVMISNMFLDLWHFVSILLVVVVAYAIASYSILYPNSVFGIDLIIDVLKSAYWNLYGELFLDEIKREEPECTFNPELYNNKTLPRCPSEVGTYAVPMMLGIYILFSNILLLNLLIAMFSNTFQQVQENSNSHWAFQRYKLTKEYEARPCLPHPFTVINYGIRLIRTCCGNGKIGDASQAYNDYDTLKQFGEDVSNEYLEHNALEKDTNKAINESLQKMTKQFESMEKRLDNMEHHQKKKEDIDSNQTCQLCLQQFHVC